MNIGLLSPDEKLTLERIPTGVVSRLLLDMTFDDELSPLLREGSPNSEMQKLVLSTPASTLKYIQTKLAMDSPAPGNSPPCFSSPPDNRGMAFTWQVREAQGIEVTMRIVANLFHWNGGIPLTKIQDDKTYGKAKDIAMHLYRLVKVPTSPFSLLPFSSLLPLPITGPLLFLPAASLCSSPPFHFLHSPPASCHALGSRALPSSPR